MTSELIMITFLAVAIILGNILMYTTKAAAERKTNELKEKPVKMSAFKSLLETM